MALEAHVPVVPVVMVDTDAVMPIGRRLPRVGRVGIVIGEPLDFSRFEGMEGDRYILRSVTDEIMVALQQLGEQKYEDVYASAVKNRIATARPQDAAAPRPKVTAIPRAQDAASPARVTPSAARTAARPVDTRDGAALSRGAVHAAPSRGLGSAGPR